MDFYPVVIVRLIHIFAGVFWAGAALLLAGFIEPTVRSIGPDGGRFMERLTQQARMPLFMNLASILAMLSGALLYWWASGGLALAWITSSSGMWYTFSGAAGTAAFFVGLIISGPSAKRMGVLGKELQAGGGPPTAAQLKELHGLRERLGQAGRLSAALLAIAVAGMAVARYL